MRKMLVLLVLLGAALLAGSNVMAQNEIAQTLVGKIFYSCRGQGLKSIHGTLTPWLLLSTDPQTVTSVQVSKCEPSSPADFWGPDTDPAHRDFVKCISAAETSAEVSKCSADYREAKARQPQTGPQWKSIALAMHTPDGVLTTATACVDPANLTRDLIETAVMRDTGLKSDPPNSGGRTPEKGMTENMLTCVFGPPQTVNDYGAAGEQLVYDGGKLLIYVGTDHRVSEIQRFGN